MCVSSAVCVQVQEFNRVDLIIKHEAPKGSNSAVMEVRLEVIMTGKTNKNTWSCETNISQDSFRL